MSEQLDDTNLWTFTSYAGWTPVAGEWSIAFAPRQVEGGRPVELVFGQGNDKDVYIDRQIRGRDIALWALAKGIIDSPTTLTSRRNTLLRYFDPTKGEQLLVAADTSLVSYQVYATVRSIDPHPDLPNIFVIVLNAADPVWRQTTGTSTTLTFSKNVASATVGYADSNIPIRDSVITVWPSASQNAGFFYLTDTNCADAGLTGDHMLVTAETGQAESTVTSASKTAGNDQVILGFVTTTGLSITSFLESTLNLRAFFSLSGTRSTTVFWRLWKVDTGLTETLIATSNTSTALTGSVTEYNLDGVCDPTVTWTSADRLRLKVYANVGSSGNDVTVTVTMEGTKDSALSYPSTTANEGCQYLREVTVVNRSDRPMVNVPVCLTDAQYYTGVGYEAGTTFPARVAPKDADGWKHHTLVDAGKARSDGYDVHVYVNDDEVDRWFGNTTNNEGGPNYENGDGTDYTKVWAYLNLPPRKRARLKTAVFDDSDQYLYFKDDITSWPDSGVLLIDETNAWEVIEYYSKDNVARSVDVLFPTDDTLARGRRGTPAAGHAVSTWCYVVETDIRITYGSPYRGNYLTAPKEDDVTKPILDLSRSNNGYWSWDYHDSLTSYYRDEDAQRYPLWTQVDRTGDSMEDSETLDKEDEQIQTDILRSFWAPSSFDTIANVDDNWIKTDDGFGSDDPASAMGVGAGARVGWPSRNGWNLELPWAASAMSYVRHDTPYNGPVVFKGRCFLRDANGVEVMYSAWRIGTQASASYTVTEPAGFYAVTFDVINTARANYWPYRLQTSMSPTTTSIKISLADDLEYIDIAPLAGFLRIDQEVVAYRSIGQGKLIISGRGLFGTVADYHYGGGSEDPLLTCLDGDQENGKCLWIAGRLGLTYRYDFTSGLWERRYLPSSASTDLYDLSEFYIPSTSGSVVYTCGSGGKIYRYSSVTDISGWSEITGPANIAWPWYAIGADVTGTTEYALLGGDFGMLFVTQNGGSTWNQVVGPGLEYHDIQVKVSGSQMSAVVAYDNLVAATTGVITGLSDSVYYPTWTKFTPTAGRSDKYGAISRIVTSGSDYYTWVAGDGALFRIKSASGGIWATDTAGWPKLDGMSLTDGAEAMDFTSVGTDGENAIGDDWVLVGGNTEASNLGGEGIYFLFKRLANTISATATSLTSPAVSPAEGAGDWWKISSGSEFFYASGNDNLSYYVYVYSSGDDKQEIMRIEGVNATGVQVADRTDPQVMGASAQVWEFVTCDSGLAVPNSSPVSILGIVDGSVSKFMVANQFQAMKGNWSNDVGVSAWTSEPIPFNLAKSGILRPLWPHEVQDVGSAIDDVEVTFNTSSRTEEPMIVWGDEQLGYSLTPSGIYTTSAGLYLLGALKLDEKVVVDLGSKRIYDYITERPRGGLLYDMDNLDFYLDPASNTVYFYDFIPGVMNFQFTLTQERA